MSLPRERFWDIPVPKIDSPTRQPLCPGTPCGRRWTRPTHAELNSAHKWLDGVSVVLADFLRGYGKHTPSPLRKSARTYAYRGLPAFASLSLAGSDGRSAAAKPGVAGRHVDKAWMSGCARACGQGIGNLPVADPLPTLIHPLPTCRRIDPAVALGLFNNNRFFLQENPVSVYRRWSYAAPRPRLPDAVEDSHKIGLDVSA